MADASSERLRRQLYYKIGEACKALDIQPYVLRYWETEFPALNPGKSRSGQRVYGERELNLIRRIKDLLYEEGYTIANAKKKLEAKLTAEEGTGDESAAGEPAAAEAAGATPEADDRLELVREGLSEALAEAQEILALLDRLSARR